MDLAIGGILNLKATKQVKKLGEDMSLIIINEEIVKFMMQPKTYY